MSSELKNELPTLFIGLKRVTAATEGRGHGRTECGKRPLQFTLYAAIATGFLTSGALEDVFSHCFLVLTWNLMCRANNTTSICLKHISWRGDALAVIFPRMKNDQMGERKQSKHVYANPIMPHVCPILSLAIYYLCFPDIHGPLLYPGHSQAERFRKRLHWFLQNHPELGVSSGVDPDDIGTHSIRKGALTYCSSGSTSCPPNMAIRHRAGWSSGVVQDIYCQ